MPNPTVHRYFAFLRGINVGGKNLIRMEDLRSLFTDLGFSGVETYIQSGNVRFDSTEPDMGRLTQKIEERLAPRFKAPVPVILRENSELKEILKRDPFPGFPQDGSLKFYICFLDRKPEKIPLLPFINEKEGLELIAVRDKNAFLVSRPLGNGRFGFPNNFIEKELRVISTARNQETIRKMAGLPEETSKSI